MRRRVAAANSYPVVSATSSARMGQAAGSMRPSGPPAAIAFITAGPRARPSRAEAPQDRQQRQLPRRGCCWPCRSERGRRWRPPRRHHGSRRSHPGRRSRATVLARRGVAAAQPWGDVQIDHVVALSDAWQKGAQGWDAQTMREFGNDPLNLLAVDGRLNGQKGDGDAATWLPPNKRFRCEYVARQITVKHTYALWVTQAEHDAMARVLADCPDQPLVERVTAPLGGPEGDPESPTPTPTPTQEPTPLRPAPTAPIRGSDPARTPRPAGTGPTCAASTPSTT